MRGKKIALKAWALPLRYERFENCKYLQIKPVFNIVHFIFL